MSTKSVEHHCYEWYTTEMPGLIKQNISPIQQFHGWNTLLVIRIILDNHQTIGTIPVNYYHWPIIINTNCLVHSGTVKLDLNQRILGSINWWMWKSKLFNLYCDPVLMSMSMMMFYSKTCINYCDPKLKYSFKCSDIGVGGQVVWNFST